MNNLHKPLLGFFIGFLSCFPVQAEVFEGTTIKSINILPENPIENKPFQITGQFDGENVIFDGNSVDGPPYQIQDKTIRVDIEILKINIACPPFCTGSQIPEINNQFTVNIGPLPAGDYSVEFRVRNTSNELEKVFTSPLTINKPITVALPSLSPINICLLILGFALLGMSASHYDFSRKNRSTK